MQSKRIYEVENIDMKLLICAISKYISADNCSNNSIDKNSNKELRRKYEMVEEHKLGLEHKLKKNESRIIH